MNRRDAAVDNWPKTGYLFWIFRPALYERHAVCKSQRRSSRSTLQQTASIGRRSEDEGAPRGE